VRAGARLHLGLLDLSGHTGRLYGGIGCILQEPVVEMVATPSLAVEVRGDRVDRETSGAIVRAAERAVESLGARPVSIEVLRELPAHSGFGSRTATILATLAMVARLSGLDVPSDRLVQLSRRGGVSGTGVHGFFQGGWIVDAGQPAGGPAVPSRLSRHETPSLLVSRIPPPDWPVGLFLIDAAAVSGTDEAEFFRGNAERAGADATSCVAVAHHKIVPGLLTADEALVGDGIRDLQSCGFKALEISNQPPTVITLIEHLRRISPIVGMSSMGPLVYAIGGNATRWASVAAQHGAWHLRTSVSPDAAEFTWLN
jgi:beta-ribofuranosylaminobenzene 5'-phosphate synthase